MPAMYKALRVGGGIFYNACHSLLTKMLYSACSVSFNIRDPSLELVKLLKEPQLRSSGGAFIIYIYVYIY